MAAIGFTLQIYFDFSGYTDMALGLARFFGVRLPPNFNSPLRASSIIDFWLRWHMTLTRFLTAYIYNPLALALTRRRLARGRPGFGGRQTTVVAFVQLLAFPTVLTMIVSGVWHGAGYLFILWGLLHGAYLVVNHAWRVIASRLWPDRESYSRVMRPVGWALTFVCVTASMVVFRSPTVATAGNLFWGMLGLNGLALPGPIYDRLAPLAGWLHIAKLGGGDVDLRMMGAWIFALAFIALACPNTLQLLGRYGPALGWKDDPRQARFAGRPIAWSASVPWLVAVSVLAVLAISHLGGQSEFLYWQF